MIGGWLKSSMFLPIQPMPVGDIGRLPLSRLPDVMEGLFEREIWNAVGMIDLKARRSRVTAQHRAENVQRLRKEILYAEPC